MPRFAAGVVRFQNEVFPSKKELFAQLSRGQSPEALFITCSDSRIETSMITQSDPGDLFVCRNAGNIVPPHTTHGGGMTASIEFACSVLKVPHIVICGHSDCGAMKGALHPEDLEGLPYVEEWLGFARPAVEAVDRAAADADEETRLQLLLEQNVRLQLRHLRNHPSVADRLSTGDLRLHGWIYDIATGDVRVFDEATDSFVAVNEYYADALARLVAEESEPG